MASPTPSEQAVNGAVARLSQMDREAKSVLKILVIDDERTLRESCRTFLSGEGYSVEVAGKGREAFDLLTSSRFDIVLIDQFMSDAPGSELLAA